MGRAYELRPQLGPALTLLNMRGSQSLGHHCQWGSHSASLYLLHQLVNPDFTFFILFPLEKTVPNSRFNGKTDLCLKDSSQVVGEQKLASDRGSDCRLLGAGGPSQAHRLDATLDLLFIYSPVSSWILYTRSPVAAESQGCFT